MEVPGGGPGKTSQTICQNCCLATIEVSLTTRVGAAAPARCSSRNAATLLLDRLSSFNNRTTFTFGAPPNNQRSLSFKSLGYDSVRPDSKTTLGMEELRYISAESGSLYAFAHRPAKLSIPKKSVTRTENGEMFGFTNLDWAHRLWT